MTVTMMDRPLAEGKGALAPAMAPSEPRVLVTTAALSLPEVALLHDAGARLILAGDDPLAFALADLVLPGALQLRLNLRQSAEIATLRNRVQAEGPLDRLILAPPSSDPVETLALMRLVLAFLPGMRTSGTRRAPGQIALLPQDGAAEATLCAFVEGLRPGLAAAGGPILTVQPAGTAAPTRRLSAHLV